MQFFIDSADINSIRQLVADGMVDGVTTNPSLIANAGRPREEIVADICAVVAGPVSTEVIATKYDAMIEEGRELAKIAPNITIKLPIGKDGLKACRTLSDEGAAVNLTLCFSPVQALLAARAGARFVSPFIGRLDDVSQEGGELLKDIRRIYDHYNFKTQILAASIRSVNHVRIAALAGSDAVTIPPKIWNALYKHPLTDKGLKIFLDAAKL